MQNSPAGLQCNYLVANFDCVNSQVIISSSLQINQDGCYIACQSEWRCQSYSWEATKSVCTLFTESVDAMKLPSTGGKISFSDLECLAPPPAPTCMHYAGEIESGITYPDIFSEEWCAIQCIATASCHSWSYNHARFGIDSKFEMCHVYTQSVVQLSPPVSSNNSLNNFGYWDKSCKCGAMTSAPPTTLGDPISTTTQPSRVACKTLCMQVGCNSYSYNSVGGTCILLPYTIFSVPTLTWEATGTWTTWDQVCP